MNDQLKQWQDEVMPADEFWSDIVTHGAKSGGAISDESFADGMAAIAGITQQMKKKPVSKKARAKGRARQRQGAGSEKRVRRELEAMGIQYITRIKTYFARGGRYAIKAEADFRGINHDGKYALIEAKDITGDRLQHSRIAKHQWANLDAVIEAGGIAYLAITHGKETAVLSWPVDGFKKGTSIKWADALRDRVNK